MPERCLDGAWTLSGWYLDLIGTVSGQNESIEIGFFTVPQKTQFSLEMSGECLESAREVSGPYRDGIRTLLVRCLDKNECIKIVFFTVPP